MGYNDLRERARGNDRRLRVGVVCPEYLEIYKAMDEAGSLNFDFVLIGDAKITANLAKESGLSGFEVIAASDDQSAAAEAVRLADEGVIDLLMKGSVRTAVLMKEVLHDSDGIRGSGFLSHIAIFELPDGRFLGVTDGGLNINPTVAQKLEIVRNAVALFHRLGNPKPKVALLSGVEVQNPAIPSTIESARIMEMAGDGGIPDAVVEGPLAFDLAFNHAACRAKKYEGAIQGDADVMLVPEIVSGNILGKALNHAAGFASGGVIVGARKPIVLLSRSDRAEEKLNSLLLAGVVT